MSSLDVRIGSSPSSGFLKLHPWESDLGGLGGNSFVSFLIDVRFSWSTQKWVDFQCEVCVKRDEMWLAWQSLPGYSSGLGTQKSASDARGGMGGAFGDLGCRLHRLFTAAHAACEQVSSASEVVKNRCFTRGMRQGGVRGCQGASGGQLGALQLQNSDNKRTTLRYSVGGGKVGLGLFDVVAFRVSFSMVLSNELQIFCMRLVNGAE